MAPSPPNNPYDPPTTASVDLPPAHDTKPASDVELPQPHIGWVILIVFGFLIFQLAVGAVIAIVCFALYMMDHDVTQEEMPQAIEAALASASSQTLMIFAASISTCLFAAALTFAVYGRKTGPRVAWRMPSVWQLLLVTMAFLPVAIFVSEISNWLIPFMPSFGEGAMEQAMLQMAKMPFPLMVIAICVLPAVGEELLFRGFIGRGLVGRHGPIVGVLVTSLLFGLVHIHPLQAISAAILGVALHFIYLTTKSLIAPMLLHFLNNLFAMICARYAEAIPIPGITMMQSEGVTHTPIGITLTSLVAAGLLLYLLYQSRSQWRGKDGSNWPFGYVTAESPGRDMIGDDMARIDSKMPNLGVMAATVVLYGGLLWLLFATMRQSLA